MVVSNKCYLLIVLLLLKTSILRLISIDSKAHSSQNKIQLITFCRLNMVISFLFLVFSRLNRSYWAQDVRLNTKICKCLALN